MPTLKDGSQVEDQRLDRIYQLDWRSLDFPITAKLETTSDLSSHPPRSQRWTTSGPLDQGPDGACVGFSSAHNLLAFPHPKRSVNEVPIDAKFAKEQIYWPAQEADEWPGGSYPGATPQYEGTSVLASAKVLSKAGLYGPYHWALNLQQLALGVMYDGPCVFAYNWYQNMFNPDGQGFVTPGGQVAGGHATLIYGVSIISTARTVGAMRWDQVDWHRSYFEIENSWGPNWALGGKFRMRAYVADMLLREQGDALFATKL